MRSIAVVQLIAWVASAVAGTGVNETRCTQIQHSFSAHAHGNAARAEAVKQAYLRSWNQYVSAGFGLDTLQPLTNTTTNDMSGWGVTIVDALDTAIVMGLTDVAAKQLEWIANVDMSKSTPALVDGFDVVIRSVGGLLSAYDLINSNLVPRGTYKSKHVKALLSQAKILGDRLKPQFNTPSGLPAFFLNWTTGEIQNTEYSVHNKTYNATNTAIAGTIILEFYRLSDLTGDQSYRKLADKAESYIVNPSPPCKYPGLVGSQLDVNTGKFLNQEFGWQSGIDSFYEYLIKTVVYNPTGNTAKLYKDFWVQAVDSTIKHLAVHPHGFPHLTFITQADADSNLMWQMDDYACFIGGNLLLGGRYLARKDMLELGLAVTDSCHQTFNTTVTGLNPVQFAWYNASNHAYDPSADTDATKRAFAASAGYFIQNGIWAGFPEPVESLFYAWRTTGDVRWADHNWSIFQAMLNTMDVSGGMPFADILDVNSPKGGIYLNYLPSYYFAEFLKYMYLTFSAPDLVSLDEFVFNTEAHPVSIQRAAC